MTDQQQLWLGLLCGGAWLAITVWNVVMANRQRRREEREFDAAMAERGDTEE